MISHDSYITLFEVSRQNSQPDDFIHRLGYLGGKGGISSRLGLSADFEEREKKPSLNASPCPGNCFIWERFPSWANSPLVPNPNLSLYSRNYLISSPYDPLPYASDDSDSTTPTESLENQFNFPPPPVLNPTP